MKAKRDRFDVKPPDTIDPKQRYSLPEAFAILRVSPAKGYGKIRKGTLRIFKDGGRSYVSGAELVRCSAPANAEGS